MRDREYEDLYYPRAPLPVAEISSVLCVAPHPDDEVFGCGGLLALLARKGCAVEILILSRGERGGEDASAALAATRVDESRRASQVLGVPPPRFLDWPDRAMSYSEPLIEDLLAALRRSRPQYLLLPALSEPHPDHQAVALAGIAAAQRCDFPTTLLFYEVGAPLHPNAIVDISEDAATKWRAVQQFGSQLGVQAYEEHARALASVRAFGTRGCTAAEAFFRVQATELRAAGAAAALPFWPVVRTRQGVANGPQQLPLVSVLVRGTDPAGLLAATASIVAQTYSHLEVVFVAAAGPLQDLALPRLERTLPLQVLRPAATAAQPRSQAANLALDAARGELAMFVDDTDLLEAGHIERLVDALASAPAAAAAYAGVRIEGADGTAGIADLPWRRERLAGADLLPLPAVLFRLDRGRAAGVQLGGGEDEVWDLWRQIAAIGEFVHCPGVSASHRQKTSEAAGALAHSRAMELARLQASCERQKLELERAFGALHALQAEVEGIRRSRSWRLTQPIRSAAQWLRTLLS